MQQCRSEKDLPAAWCSSGAHREKGVRGPTGSDPLIVLGMDVFISNVLPRLNAPSLAAGTAVCSDWRICCISDHLWHPLLANFLSLYAHIPLVLSRSLSSPSSYVAYSIVMLDAAKDGAIRGPGGVYHSGRPGGLCEKCFRRGINQLLCLVELTREEMCARIWKIKVKPTCGPYWVSLDPTSRGESPLLRRFLCDHSVMPIQEKDPIWGGQESVWKFVKAKVSKQRSQCVQINSWPYHRVLHLSDGRWCLDNYYASYTSCADKERNMPSFLKGKIGCCQWCNPAGKK